MHENDSPQPVPPAETTTPPHGDPLRSGEERERPPVETPGVPRTEDPSAAPERVRD